MNKIWTALGLTLMVTFFVSQASQAASVIVYDNGYSVTVPDGWEVSVNPEGFNSLPYHDTDNPKGKLDGWGGWPWYDLYLQVNYNCHPGELVISPSWCPPQPEILVTPEPCVPLPMPEPEPEPKCTDRDHGKPGHKRHSYNPPEVEECHDNRGKQGEKCKKNKDD